MMVCLLQYYEAGEKPFKIQGHSWMDESTLIPSLSPCLGQEPGNEGSAVTAPKQQASLKL